MTGWESWQQLLRSTRAGPNLGPAIRAKLTELGESTGDRQCHYGAKRPSSLLPFFVPFVALW